MVTDRHLYLSPRHHQPTPEPATPHLFPSVEAALRSAEANIHPQSIRPDTEENTTSSPGSTTANGRRILGLAVPVFWGFLIALAVILAAAIGGGLGGGLAANRDATTNNYNANNTHSGPPGETLSISNPPAPPPIPTGTDSATKALSSTTTTATLPPKEQPSTLLGGDGCPDINRTVYTSPEVINGTNPGINLQRQVSAQSFVQLCNTDFPKGSNNNKNENNQVVQDLNPLFSGTFEQCMYSCAVWNSQYQEGRVDQRCRAVSFVKHRTFSHEYQYQPIKFSRVLLFR
ncbi:hypothetical protein PG984_006835 [Apiospora sp. TS-2023a]